jgi:Fur family ferric uptake transcriptional regulator
MAMKAQYRTRHREELLDYLRSKAGKHITVAEIAAHFAALDKPIGTVTIYRQLESMVEEGLVAKYNLDENTGACFEYIDPEHNCHHPRCYHCKCEKCGRLIHLDCHELDTLAEHLLEHHRFQLDPTRIVLYGVCDSCLTLED